MTTPAERTRAVLGLAESTQALAPYMHGSSETVRVPRELLRQLHAWLRHYPCKTEIALSARDLPQLWGNVND